MTEPKSPDDTTAPTAPTAPTASIKLYTQLMNPFSEKVAAALALKGLPFERIISDDPEDIQRLSPIARTLPVLEIDGRRKADSIKIIAWLDQLYPTPSLYSPDPKTAATQRNLADWSDNSFSWYWNRWRTARYPQPGDETPIEDSLIHRIKDQIGRTLGRAPQTRADMRELEVIRELQDRMDDLVGFLRDRPFFYSDEPSIADISVYSMLVVLQSGTIPGCAEAIAARPTLATFLDRMVGRIKSLEQPSA
jgi:glutathione S-transferase